MGYVYVAGKEYKTSELRGSRLFEESAKGKKFGKGFMSHSRRD